MRYLITGILALLISCGGNGGGEPPPPTGSLEITTGTFGAPDTDFTFSIDGGAARPIGPNESVTVSELEPGPHAVEVGGLPLGCTVDGSNPRSIEVTAESTAQLVFAITCVAPLGTIQVVTTSSGPAPNTFALLLDGLSQGIIAAIGTQALPDIRQGSHSVGVSSVPANCQIQETNPQTVEVMFDQITTVAFSITCVAPPADAGTLVITTSTTGGDPNGYLVRIDGGAAQPLAAAGDAVIENLTPGSHSVQLSDVEEGCTAGANTITVAVPAGGSATLAFHVNCIA